MSQPDEHTEDSQSNLTSEKRDDDEGSADEALNATGLDEDSSEADATKSEEIAEKKPRLGPPKIRAKIIRKYSQLSLILLGIIAVIYSLYFARAILIPMTLAFLLFFLLSPLVRFLSRYRFINESAAAGIIVILSTAAFGISAYYLAAPVTSWIRQAPQTFRDAEQKLKVFYQPVGEINDATEKMTNLAADDDEEVVKVAVQQPPVTSYLLSSTANVLAGTLMTIVLLYLLLAVGRRSINSIVELLPSVQDKKGLVRLLHDIEKGISSYLLTITLINVCLGIVVGTVLGLLGLPDPWLLGIMVAVLNFIPFAGGVVGVGVVLMISVVTLESPLEIALGPLLYFIINSIEGNLITPIILGRSMKLNPAIVFICIIFWGWLWGIGGILLAVPLIGITKIAFSHFKELRPIAHILTG